VVIHCAGHPAVDPGLKAPRSLPPFAAQIAADKAAKKAKEYGMQKIDVFVKGPGSGRESTIRSYPGSRFTG